MFKYLAIMLIVSCAFAGKIRDTKTVLAEIDQDKFGNTMISAISLSVAAKAPLEDIVVLIDQIIESVNTKQSEADKANATNQADCDETITALQGQIAETTAKISQLETTIADNEEILAQAKVDLKQANEDYDETVQAIEVGTAERKAAHEKWANEDYDQTIQITTLDEGTKLINHMLHGVAFAQIQTRYEKVLDKLKSSTGSHASLFKPLVTSLTQLAAKLNYDNVMNILKLLSDIRSSIVQAQTEARQAEEASQAEWDAALKILEAQKKALADKRARLTALIQATENLLAECRKSLENNRVNLEESKASLSDKEAQCAAWSADYQTVSNECERELQILEQLREHCIEKSNQAMEYYQDRQANAPGF